MTYRCADPADGGYSPEVLLDTPREGVALASSGSTYLALSEATKYMVRVSARNDQGYGPSARVEASNTNTAVTLH